MVRYDPITGDYIDEFVTVGTGGLEGATGLAFGPDGQLYVGSFGSDEVLRFDGETGDFIDAYVTEGLGGLFETYYFDFIPRQQVLVVPD